MSKNKFIRYSFEKTTKDKFYFGTAVAAYQVEGEAAGHGRKPSIWDIYTHKQKERITDQSNGDVAIDFYNRYHEDLKLLKEMNMNAFRFSISWSRLLPTGKVFDGANPEGVAFYNNLIDDIIAHGMEPFVTLFHWDFPQALEEFGGFRNSYVVNYFRDYAELCFQLFGNRVKHWITLNEPWAYASLGYDSGVFAPGRCSSWIKDPCPSKKAKTCPCKDGDSATEPYIVAHNLILSHAAAVQLYREKYKDSQKGTIGFTLNSYWYEPASTDRKDVDAASRLLDFEYGWFLHPVTYGSYPKSMRTLVGSRLPIFTSEQAKIVKGSLDFLGFNYYSSYYAKNYIPPRGDPPRFLTDYRAEKSQKARNGSCIGREAGLATNYIWAEGLRRILYYTKHKYNNPLIYITENGFSDKDRATKKKTLSDTCRTKYFIDHLHIVYQSITADKVKIRGYFAWSFADNFEWSSGYTVRFGLIYVDYHDNLKRIKKSSSRWMTAFLNKRKSSFGINATSNGIRQVTDASALYSQNNS